MKPENIEKIHESFAQQAAEFEKPGRIFSKKEYLDYIVIRQSGQGGRHA